MNETVFVFKCFSVQFGREAFMVQYGKNIQRKVPDNMEVP